MGFRSWGLCPLAQTSRTGTVRERNSRRSNPIELVLSLGLPLVVIVAPPTVLKASPAPADTPYMSALVGKKVAASSTGDFFLRPAVESWRRSKKFARSRVIPVALIAILGFAFGLPSTGASTPGPSTLYGQFSNGLPTSASFFPIGVWYQNPAGGDVPTPYTDQAQAFEAMGVNVFVGVSQENGIAWPESYGVDEGEMSAAAAEAMYVVGGGDPDCSASNSGADPCDTAHASVDSVQQLLSSLPAADAQYLVGYQWTDEPPCNIDIASQASTIDSEDPSRMTYANEGAWTSALPSNDIGSPSGSGLTNAQCLSEAEANLVATSIVSSDDYALTDPWHSSVCAGANCIYLYGNSAANMRALAGPTKPIWSFIESGTDDLGLSTQNGACNWTTNLCASGNEAVATPVQVNSAAWDALINGANGLEWFCGASDIGSTGTTNSGTTAYDACAGGGGDGSAVDGSTIIPANLKYIDNTVESYAPELNAPDVTGMEVASSNSSVPIVDMLKQVNGEDYFFVESDRDGSTTATYTDPSLAGLTATLVYDSAAHYEPAASEQGQTFTFSPTGTFSDALGTTTNPYQVKIYAIAGVDSVAPTTTTTTQPPPTTTTTTTTTTTLPPPTTTTTQPPPTTTTTQPPTTTTTTQLPVQTHSTLSTSVNPAVVGGAVVFTAAVSTGQGNTSELTGTVAFSEDGKPISVCSNMGLTNSGTTTCKVSFPTVGANTIAANYSGNATYAPSTSGLLEETVSRATTTRLRSSRNHLEVGQLTTFTAIVGVGSSGAGSPTGSITLSANGEPISDCANMAMANSRASCTVAFSTTGTEMILASYLGSTNYAPSTSDAFEETVNLGLNRWTPHAFPW